MWFQSGAIGVGQEEELQTMLNWLSPFFIRISFVPVSTCVCTVTRVYLHLELGRVMERWQSCSHAIGSQTCSVLPISLGAQEEGSGSGSWDLYPQVLAQAQQF